jgi:hypothetical protein
MRVAALFDVHGNPPALGAVIVDVLRGPFQEECLSVLRDVGAGASPHGEISAAETIGHFEEQRGA